MMTHESDLADRAAAASLKVRALLREATTAHAESQPYTGHSGREMNAARRRFVKIGRQAALESLNRDKLLDELLDLPDAGIQ